MVLVDSTLIHPQKHKWALGLETLTYVKVDLWEHLSNSLLHGILCLDGVRGVGGGQNTNHNKC